MGPRTSGGKWLSGDGMRVSSRAGAVEEDGGGRCACFLEAELAVLDQLERGREGAAEEFEQHVGGKVLPEKSVLEAAREHRSHRRGDEALDLLRVALDLFADEDGVAFADCGQRADDSLDRLFDGGTLEAGGGEAGGSVCKGVGSECIEQCFPIGVVAIQGGTADAGRGCD